MGLNKRSLRIIVGLVSLLLLFLGLGLLGLNGFQSYTPTLLALAVAAVLVVEAGLKSLKFKRWALPQWISVIVALALGIIGVLKLPFIDATSKLIDPIGAVAMFAAVIILIGELNEL